MEEGYMFTNRREAGKKLGHALKQIPMTSPLVLALPRGGVVVGYEIARILHAPLDVIVARKLGAPGNPEFGIGAIAEEHSVFLNADAIAHLGLTKAAREAIQRNEQIELNRRIRKYRKTRSLPDLTARTVILTDDGLATGVTAKAAILSLRKKHPGKLLFASPVCARQTAEELRSIDIPVICTMEPSDLTSIGSYYRTFPQTKDEEVVRLLAQNRKATKLDSYK